MTAGLGRDTPRGMLGRLDSPGRLGMVRTRGKLGGWMSLGGEPSMVGTVGNLSRVPGIFSWDVRWMQVDLEEEELEERMEEVK